MAAEQDDLVDQLEREWRDALCAKDMDRLRSLIHPQFVLIGTRSTGPFSLRRDEWLQAIQQREVVDIKLQVRDSTVLDGVIIGTVHARWVVRYLERQFDDCVLLTDVWVQQDGRWQVIRRHSSSLPSNECLAG